MNILLLVGGLLLILLGANGLTDGCLRCQTLSYTQHCYRADNRGLRNIRPELTVSVSSALKGSADIAIGNVVGSNIFNTLVIVGCTALFAPIAITRNTLQKEIPLCILSSIALLVCANDVFLNGDGANILSITDGLLLLVLLRHILELHFCHCLTYPRRSGRWRREHQAAAALEIRSLHLGWSWCSLLPAAVSLWTAQAASHAAWE